MVAIKYTRVDFNTFYLSLFCIGVLVIGLFKASIGNFVTAGHFNFLQFLFYYASSAFIWFLITPLVFFLLKRISSAKIHLVQTVLIIMLMCLVLGFGQRVMALLLDFSIRGFLDWLDPGSPYALKNGVFGTLSNVLAVIITSGIENVLILLAGVIVYYIYQTNRPRDAGILKLNNGTVIRLIDIEAICSDKNYVEVVTNQNKVYRNRATLSRLERTLDKGFIKIHRSYIVNKSAVKSIEPLYFRSFKVITHSGKILTSSPRYYSAVRSL